MKQTSNISKYDKVKESLIYAHQNYLDKPELIKIIKKIENSPFEKIIHKIIHSEIIKSKNLQNKLNYAKYLIRKQNNNDALSIFESLLIEDKENPVIWHYYITTLKRIGAKKASLKKLRTAKIKTKKSFSILILETPPEFSSKFIHSCINCNSLNELNELRKHIIKKPIEAPYKYYLQSKIDFLTNNFKKATINILKSIEQIPTEHRFWVMISKITHAMGKYEEAYDAAIEAITIELNNFTLYNLLNTSNTIKLYYTFDYAVSAHITNNKNDVETLNIKALRYRLSRNEQRAIDILKESLELKPAYKETYKELAYTYFQSGTFKNSLIFFKEYLSLSKSHVPEIQILLYTMINASMLNDWNTVELYKEKCFNNLQQLKKINSIYPAFYCLALTDSMLIHKEIAKITAKSYIPIKSNTLTSRGKIYENHQKIRIGFLSGDIGEHISSRILLNLLKKESADNFDIFIYSYRRNDNSKLYQTLNENYKLIDLTTISDYKAANEIFKNEIDILVDLTLYTSNSRSNIMSFRPAPIQLHHIGYPSTSGSDSVYDFTILRNELVSNDSEKLFSENLALVHTNKTIKLSSATLKIPLDKHNYDLPNNKFILASFNEPYKITKHMFDLWCEILLKNSNAVLWLYVNNPEQKDNITKYILEKNININRIIFTNRVSFEEHKKRLQIADLILDTFPYGNHSSAKLALMCGTPLISYKGRSVASRYSSFYLEIADLSELICDNDLDFVETANKFIKDKKFRENCLMKLYSKNYSKEIDTQEENQSNINYFDIYMKIYNHFKNMESSDKEQRTLIC